MLTPSPTIGYACITLIFLTQVGLTYLIVVQTQRRLFSQGLGKLTAIHVVRSVVLWAFAEFVIAWLVSAIWMGRGGSWDSLMPFYSLTPFTMQTPLRFLARFFGYFGTSALIGVGIILFVTKNWKSGGVYGLILVFLSTLSWFIYKTPNGVFEQTVIVSEYLSEPSEVVASSGEFVLLPEYGIDGLYVGNMTGRIKADSEVYFSGTQQTISNGGMHNVLIYGTTKQGFLYQEPKNRLVTAGEHLPISLEVMLRTFSPSAYSDFQIKRSLVKGSKSAKPFVVSDKFVIGNAACSSIIQPDDYRKLTQKGATVLANSASLEIFRGSRLFGIYHDGFAKFMATANARPFLQSSNNWPAFALDHNGNTLANVQPTGTEQVTIQTNNRKTPYTYLGEWVAYLGGLYLAKELITKLKPNLKRLC